MRKTVTFTTAIMVMTLKNGFIESATVVDTCVQGKNLRRIKCHEFKSSC